ncbi:MAG TPA: universal stress protein [Gemmatimonadales bacterium]|jgi:nucleotide-binding universal stress UspA family protein|nr:universal stress protein [Gemmatimonadales bacterium]
MFRTILVPLDGSRFAEAALPLATALAKSARGRLHLLLAHQPVAAMVGMGDVVVASDGLDEELRQRELNYLAEVSGRLGQIGGGSVAFSVVDGPAGRMVLEEAAGLGANLIVIATHGRGAIGRLWLGSVADHVVRHATVPVLLVHPDRPGGTWLERPIRGVLVPLDLSAEAEGIVPTVATLVAVTQAHVTLLHVVEPFYYTVDPALPYPVPQDATITELRCAEAQRRLDRTADRLRERGVAVSTRVTVGASGAAGILDLLERKPFDLVAMTTHGAGGIKRLLLGSVADKVIRGAAKPVLVLRPGAAGDG